MYTLTGKIEMLRTAGFRIGYADPCEAYLGSYVSWSGVRDFPFDGGMPVVVLDGVAKGEDRFDQSTTWQRSNFRSLLRDYGQALIPVSYPNVDVLALFPHSVSDELIDTVVSFSDYVIYDENDMAYLELEEIEASFGGYLWADTQNILSPEAQDIAGRFDLAEIQDAFFGEMYADDYFPDHDGLDVLWDEPTVVRLLESALAKLAGAASASR